MLPYLWELVNLLRRHCFSAGFLATSTIFAGLGVGGLAVAPAAKKTIENLFGGISVIGDRPVLVGEVCRFGDCTGTTWACAPPASAPPIKPSSAFPVASSRPVSEILKNHGWVETGALPVRFVGVGTYSLNIEVAAYISTSDYDEVPGAATRAAAQNATGGGAGRHSFGNSSPGDF